MGLHKTHFKIYKKPKISSFVAEEADFIEFKRIIQNVLQNQVYVVLGKMIHDFVEDFGTDEGKLLILTRYFKK